MQFCPNMETDEKKLISLLQNLMFTAKKMPYHPHNRFKLIRIDSRITSSLMKHPTESCVV
jgi:hypothetical protein